MAGLDPEQRAAAESTDGPVIIIAGPGTGKTRTLTHRIAYLVAAKGIAPEHILAVTFTKRAANEMRERLRKLLPTQAEAALVTTFHGLGMRLLRDYGAKLGLAADFRIANETERRALLVEKMGLIEHKAGQLLKKVAKWKRGGRPDDEVETTSGAGIPPPCVAGYEEAMRLRGWLDFDDLIGLAVELLEQHPDIAAQCRERFGHVSVDEFQDIDEWQYRLIKLLVPAGGNLCVIGDPDQSVYSFRGAAPRFFRQCASDFPGAREVRLHRNYRSARAIVAGALQAIAPGSLVEGRVLEALNADATRIAIHEAASDKAEAEFVVHTIEKLIGGHGFFSLDSGRVEGSEARSDYSFADFAVFYRTEAQADVIAGALARSGIPFQRRAHALLGERPEVQALLEGARSLKDGRSVLDRLKAAVEMTNVECRMTNGPRDETSAAGRGLSRPTSELHSSFVIRISELASRCGNDFALFESELALLSDADLWDPRAQCVSLLTLHASKGLEFPVVFITGCEDGLLPLRFGPRDDVDLNEERRLFFVGMTRARERLVLSHAKKRLWRGQLRQQAVSPFVAAIERELLERSKAPAFKPSAKALDSQMDLFVTT
jgi:DNA helicase-2/ATP-dependent DNA helicase PcrA